MPEIKVSPLLPETQHPGSDQAPTVSPRHLRSLGASTGDLCSLSPLTGLAAKLPQVLTQSLLPLEPLWICLVVLSSFCLMGTHTGFAISRFAVFLVCITFRFAFLTTGFWKRLLVLLLGQISVSCYLKTPPLPWLQAKTNQP